MKVALVRYRYNPFGGAEKFVNRALQALAQAGAQPTVICSEWNAGPAPREYDLQAVGRGFALTRKARDEDFERRVHAAIASGGFDLVQSHERIPGCDVYRAGDGLHSSWLAEWARVQPSWRRWATRASPYHRFVLAREQALFTHPRLRAVICNSEMVRQDIRARFGIEPSQLRLIRNGVDLNHFCPPSDAQRKEARSALGIAASATVFVYVGSGFERKGVAQLLRGLARVPAGLALIVGPDKHGTRYERLAASLGLADRAHFAGAQAEVRPYLWAADAMVFPTLYDPCPNAVLEAMACGLPVITSTRCGAAELIHEGACGRVVDALDIAGLAGAMADYTDAALTRAEGAAARQAMLPLSTQAMAESLLALYREFV